MKPDSVCFFEDLVVTLARFEVSGLPRSSRHRNFWNEIDQELIRDQENVAQLEKKFVIESVGFQGFGLAGKNDV